MRKESQTQYPKDTRMRYVPLDLEIMFAINFSSLMAEIMHLGNEEKITSFRE